VRALLEHDAAVERWLREEVVIGHAEYLGDSSKAVQAEEVLGRIKARRKAPKACEIATTSPPHDARARAEDSTSRAAKR